MGLSSLWPSCILEVRIGNLPPLLFCVFVFQGEMSKNCYHLATAASTLDFAEENIHVR